MDNFTIRKTVPADLQEILAIYKRAQSFMASAGNPDQWGTTYPEDELVKEDISVGRSYVVTKDGRTEGVFVVIDGSDPVYDTIEGQWLSDRPCCTVHRVASMGREKGVTAAVLDWCLEKWGSVRIDTHEKNIPMQGALKKSGFTCCGRVWLEDNSPRIAFQKDAE